MTRKEVLEKITKPGDYYTIIKQEYLNELSDMASKELCSWGEQVGPLVEMYECLNRDVVSEAFAQAFFDQIIDFYMHMLEFTKIVEKPAREEVIKYPAETIREWDY